MNFIARQGDIWIEAIKELPKSLKAKKDNVIAMGDSTNLAHRLIKGKVLIDKEENIYLDVPTKTQIIHDHGKGRGHKSIPLSKGKYKIIRQRETTMGDMTRIVQD